MAATEAFEAELDQVVALGWAHIERVAFQGFMADGCVFPEAQAALKVLLTDCLFSAGGPAWLLPLCLVLKFFLIKLGITFEPSFCFCTGASSPVRFDQGGA